MWTAMPGKIRRNDLGMDNSNDYCAARVDEIGL
jgi:hypothetical protein